MNSFCCRCPLLLLCLLVAVQTTVAYDAFDNTNPAGEVFTYPAGGSAGFSCDANAVCNGTKFVIEKDNVLNYLLFCYAGAYSWTCVDASVVVFGSDLLNCSNENFCWLDCDSFDPFEGACDHMNLTLVDSTLQLWCRYNSCRDFKAYLYGSSHLKLHSDTSLPTDRQFEVFLLSAEAVFEDLGKGPYIVHNYSQPTTTGVYVNHVECWYSLWCAHSVIEFPPKSVFSFDCNVNSCNGTKFIIGNGSELIGKMDCWSDHMSWNCYAATVVVFGSDLLRNFDIPKSSVLDCDNLDGFEGACDYMNLTLVDSSVRLWCKYDSCRDFKAYLYGSSHLVIHTYTTLPSDRQLQVFLLSPNALITDNGITPYVLHSYEPTTTEVPVNHVVCNSVHWCAHSVIEFPPESVFSFECKQHSCNGTKFIVGNGSELRDPMNCWSSAQSWNCYGATVVVFGSNLLGFYKGDEWFDKWLDCDTEAAYEGSCDRMNITLVDSSLRIWCTQNSCRDLKAYLYGSSHLVIHSSSNLPTDRQLQVEVFLLSPNALITDNGKLPYVLHSYETTEMPLATTSTTTQLITTHIGSVDTTMESTPSSTRITQNTTTTGTKSTDGDDSHGSQRKAFIDSIHFVSFCVGLCALLSVICLHLVLRQMRKRRIVAHEKAQSDKLNAERERMADLRAEFKSLTSVSPVIASIVDKDSVCGPQKVQSVSFAEEMELEPMPYIQLNSHQTNEAAEGIGTGVVHSEHSDDSDSIEELFEPGPATDDCVERIAAHRIVRASLSAEPTEGVLSTQTRMSDVSVDFSGPTPQLLSSYTVDSVATLIEMQPEGMPPETTSTDA